MRSELGKPEVNLARMGFFVRKASSSGVHIICFPEACVTGYGVDPSIVDHALMIPGKETDVIVKLAKDCEITILAGMIEKASKGSLYITHAVVSPDGKIGIYRKIHLAPPERRIFKPGADLPLFKASGVTFGVGLCYDGHFPELCTILALKGAEVLFFPHASPRGSPEQKMARWMRYLPARSYDNGLFLVACNQTGRQRYGLSFPGVGLIIDPKGRIIARSTGWRERMITAWLRGDLLKKVRTHSMSHFLANRRPEVYGYILKKWEESGDLATIEE